MNREAGRRARYARHTGRKWDLGAYRPTEQGNHAHSTRRWGKLAKCGGPEWTDRGERSLYAEAHLARICRADKREEQQRTDQGLEHDLKDAIDFVAGIFIIRFVNRLHRLFGCALRHGDLHAVVVIAEARRSSFFTPLPGSRNVCPPCVPAGMRARTGPWMVGTSTSAPRIASPTLIGRSMWMSSPRRSKNGCGRT